MSVEKIIEAIADICKRMNFEDNKLKNDLMLIKKDSNIDSTMPVLEKLLLYLDEQQKYLSELNIHTYEGRDKRTKYLQKITGLEDGIDAEISYLAICDDFKVLLLFYNGLVYCQYINLLPSFLQSRYEELIKAINNDMPLSFFWLAGSIIEGLLCEYCNKNDIKIKSCDHNIKGYITAIEEDEKHKKIIAGVIKKIIQIYKDDRNTIHPDNHNTDFIQDENLQNRKKELDDVIKRFSK